MVKISDAIAEFLVKNNIKYVFGIIGSANSHIYDSINKNKNIKLIPVHHEQAAVMAAGAYYRASGKMEAIALVTAGAGSSNAFTGILSSWADSIPTIIISGQEKQSYVDEYKDMRMYGVQGYDSVEIYSKHTKHSIRLNRKNVLKELKKSFLLSQSGRPGPVFIEVPFDVQAQHLEEDNLEIEDDNIKTNKNNYENIIELLNKSIRPVILGGHGVKLSGSEVLFKSFVEKTGIPTLLTWSAIDLLETSHPQNYGKSGVQGQRAANFIIQNCDLLIVFGSRLSLLQTGYARENFAQNAHIVHIDIDPSETKKFNGTNINACVKDVLTYLCGIDYNIKIQIKSWIDYCNEIKNKYPVLILEHLKDLKNSYTFIDWFSKKLSDNYIIVTDMGTALLSGFYGFNLKANQKMFTSLGLGEMGYGLAAAVGAGFSGRPVMCLNCDGGMMLNLQELQTIKTQNLPVKIVIFNNDGYLMIKQTQNLLFNGVKTCVDKNTGVELPDYKKIANAFDYEYYTVNQVDEFLNSKNQAILEVFMDPNQEFIPKVKGTKNIDNTIQPGILEEMYPFLPYEEIKNVMISGINKISKSIIR